MKHKSFGEFVDKKKRESVRQLRLIKQLLEHSGLKVDNFLETDSGDDPYVFCYAPMKNTGFDGIRIYKIGNQLAFRVQRENKTHPFGAAYPLPIEEMFNDFLSDEGIKQAQAGKKVMEAVTREIRKFFDKSLEADRKSREKELDNEKDPQGNVMVRTTGTDYSALIYNK